MPIAIQSSVIWLGYDLKDEVVSVVSVKLMIVAITRNSACPIKRALCKITSALILLDLVCCMILRLSDFDNDLDTVAIAIVK